VIKELIQNVLSIGLKKGKGQPGQKEEKKPQPLVKGLDENLRTLQQVFDLCSDVTIRKFKTNTNKPIEAAVIYINEITDLKTISERVLEPLLLKVTALPSDNNFEGKSVINIFRDRLSIAASIRETNDLSEVTRAVLDACIVLLIDGSPSALLMDAVGGEGRAIDEPDSEPNVRGPKDGFVENLTTNLMLIRRRLRTNQFKVEALEVGSLTRTKISVCYIKGIADDKLVEEVKLRIKRIRIDGILASGYIEEMIRDEPMSIFPLVQSTERPDKTAASLLEGRVAILVDNTPMTLIVPCTFVSLLHASEDYYITPTFATFIRLLRFFALNIALMLPALTVAAFAFHQELLPTALLNTVAGARQDLPFPIFLEIFAMEITFELLREAGVRLPKTIGQAISTVGGLVIGQAAVNAGFVSPLSVIVVALTAVASFTVPSYPVGTTIRILRFVLLLLAAFLGAVGIMLGLMTILFHLNRLRSFGVPYLSPISPLNPRDLKDTFIRVPWWAMLTRPRFFGSEEPERQPLNQGPIKPGKEGDNHR
jgi:spore germination protein KA